MVAVVYTTRVNTPKGAPDKATFTIEMKKAKVEGNRCTNKNNKNLKEDFSPHGCLFVRFFPLTASLFEEKL